MAADPTEAAPLDLGAPEGVDRRDLDPEELRVAVVLNGGVSLAVWMGGVTTELDRLHRGDGAYGEVLDLLASDARVDVVSGSSAGGVNGALLAAAVASRRPLVGLRDLWIKEGSFDLLLRNPRDRHLPSMLKGDEHLYGALIRAFDGVLGAEPPGQPLDPIHLWITTSLLQGERVAIPDGFGGLIPDRNHLGLFEFSSDQPGQWHPDGLSRRLALAARCSSSYPGAFEPSLCPVEETRDGRPDMARHVRFRGTRYTVDGGALMNKPFEPALRSVYRRPADRQVRRVVAYVAPLPGRVDPGHPEDPVLRPPGVLETLLKTVVDLPRNQSVASELATITEHNERVAALRRTRTRLMLSPGLLEDARRLYPAYRTSRTDASVERILDQLDAGVARHGLPEDLLPPNRSALRPALARARGVYLPSGFPSDDELLAAARPAGGDGTWEWGASPVEHLAMTVLDVIRRASVLAPPDRADLSRVLRDAREQVHEVREHLVALEDWDDSFWPGQSLEAARVSASPGGFTDSWALGAFAVWRARAGDRMAALPGLAWSLAAVLVGLRSPVGEIARLARTDREHDPAAELGALLSALAPSGPDRPADGAPDAEVARCLRALLAVEVTLAVTLADAPEYEQGVRLKLISGEAGNGFDGRSRAEAKLAGDQLAHFGAFYKHSWRANDWMFGRLDAAWQLASVVLSPDRLKQLGYGPEEALVRIRAIAVGEGSTPDVTKYLGRRLLGDHTWEDDARAELAFLGDEGIAPRPALDRCAEAIARRLQVEVLTVEIPALVAACELDVASGASAAAAADLRAEWKARFGPARLDRIPARDAVALFRRVRIGSESLVGERGTDQFLRATTTAAAVGAGVLADSSLGRSSVRPLFVTISWLTRSFRRITEGRIWWRDRRNQP